MWEEWVEFSNSSSLLWTKQKVVIPVVSIRSRAHSRSLESGMLSLGETGELSPNASAMLRISALSAWAQLQVSSVHQKYLHNVVKPYRPTLSSLWIAALRDYACIRIDSEFLHDTSSVALDSSYSNLGKEVLLPVSSCDKSSVEPHLKIACSIIPHHGLSYSRLLRRRCRLMTLTSLRQWMEEKLTSKIETLFWPLPGRSPRRSSMSFLALFMKHWERLQQMLRLLQPARLQLFHPWKR